MPHHSLVIKVAIPVPLRKLFDYLPPDNCNEQLLKTGARVKVPFGKNKVMVGMIISKTHVSELEPSRLKRIYEVLDDKPLLSNQHINFLVWASAYYHHPVGEAVFSCLPTLLRKGAVAQIRNKYWYRVQSDIENVPGLLKHAPKQLAIYNYIAKFNNGLDAEKLKNKFSNYHAALKILLDKGLLQKTPAHSGPGLPEVHNKKLKLSMAQMDAVSRISGGLDKFNAFLLNGITGSGKTEVYLRCVESVINNGKQVLILVPEIGLTPQLINRIRHYFKAEISIMHSSLSDQERANAWLKAGLGMNKIILGTRSAIWVPLNNPGLIIIDEEHDISYKQQDGFKYSARDMALVRGQRENIPVILGSATPSMESLQNALSGKFIQLELPERTRNATLPGIKLLDMRKAKTDGAFSLELLNSIETHLNNKHQVMIFQNRRGYAPVIMCHDCGYIFICDRCETQMTFHKQKNKLHCHHCEREKTYLNECPECSGNNLVQIGYGTERLDETLKHHFPSAEIVRIDRDTTRRKNALESILARINSGEIDIMIGTQMLTKGHDFPGLTLVGIIDTDRGLFSNDYRSSERMAQIITQVCGRSGRGEIQGEVIIQTHYPTHPLLLALCKHDYQGFANMVLSDRKQANLPPFSYHVLLHAESTNLSTVNRFLLHAKEKLNDHAQIEIFGPMISPIEKIKGQNRMQMILQATDRSIIKNILDQWLPLIEKDKLSRKVRWYVDIDPQDLS